MEKELTEREAWLTIAEIWKNTVPSPWDKNERVVYVGSADPIWGLCGVMHELDIDLGMIETMQAKLPPRILDSDWCWGFTTEDAKARIAFCERMAAELDKQEDKDNAKREELQEDQGNRGQLEGEELPSPQE